MKFLAWWLLKVKGLVNGVDFFCGGSSVLTFHQHLKNKSCPVSPGQVIFKAHLPGMGKSLQKSSGNILSSIYDKQGVGLGKKMWKLLAQWTFWYSSFLFSPAVYPRFYMTTMYFRITLLLKINLPSLNLRMKSLSMFFNIETPHWSADFCISLFFQDLTIWKLILNFVELSLWRLLRVKRLIKSTIF